MFFCSQVAALARAASRHERWARAAAEETAGPAQRGRPRVPAGPAHERARAGVHADGVRRCWLKAKRRKAGKLYTRMLVAPLGVQTFLYYS